jgi:hypothetical protein
MTRKFAGKRDYAVAKLEAQWFMEGESKVPRKEWRWKLFSDPRRVPPARLRTILREPVRKE